MVDLQWVMIFVMSKLDRRSLRATCALATLGALVPVLGCGQLLAGAVAPLAARSPDASSGWSPMIPAFKAPGLREVAIWSASCAVPGSCVVTTQTGFVATWQGGRWSGVQLLPDVLDGPERPQATATTTVNGTPPFPSISCPSTKFCMLVDRHGGAWYYSGEAWSLSAAGMGVSGDAASVTAANTLLSLSCASATFCTAVDASGGAYTFTPTGWSAPDQVTAGNALSTVSCPVVGWCVAGGDDGYAYFGSGPKWGQGQAVNPTVPLVVSCAAKNFCAAVSQRLLSSGAGMLDGYVYARGHWSGPDPLGVGGVWGISCPAAGYCVAVGFRWAEYEERPESFILSGSSWHPVQAGAGNMSMNSVSCPSVSYCVATTSWGLFILRHKMSF